MLLRRWREGEELFGEDHDQLVHGRKTADMVLSYGRKAVEALMVYGVGPVTSYQVLSRMLPVLPSWHGGCSFEGWQGAYLR